MWCWYRESLTTHGVAGGWEASRATTPKTYRKRRGANINLYPTPRRAEERTRPYLVILASLAQALPGLQPAAQAAVVGLLLVDLLLMRVHQEQEVRVALLQAPTGHLGALDLALQLGHLLLKQNVAGGDAPVVEGKDDDDQQQHHQHEGGQAAGPPVGPETHHGAGSSAAADTCGQRRPALRAASGPGPPEAGLSAGARKGAGRTRDAPPPRRPLPRALQESERSGAGARRRGPGEGGAGTRRPTPQGWGRGREPEGGGFSPSPPTGWGRGAQGAISSLPPTPPLLAR